MATTLAPIEIRPQTAIPARKALRLVVRGLGHRRLRAGLTTLVVLGAVAFFTMMIAESLLLTAARRGVAAEIADHRAGNAWLAHVLTPGSPTLLTARLSSSDTAFLAELSRVTTIPENEIAALAADARRERDYVDFFARMELSKRVVLVRLHEGTAIFAYLAVAEHAGRFRGALAEMPSIRIPGGVEPLLVFARTHSDFLGHLDATHRAWSARLATLSQNLATLTGGETTVAWLARADEASAQRWADIVRAAGFSLSPDTLDRARRFAGIETDRAALLTHLAQPTVREAWRRTFHTRLTPEAMLVELDRPDAAAVVGSKWSPATLAAVAADTRDARQFAHLEATLLRATPPSAAPLSGASNIGLRPREWFLLGISLLVCFVGITNAMLMAVTERFREIATMKCLGATDGYVLKQFLLEAAVHGSVGGALGALAGLSLGVAKTALLHGDRTFVYFPTGPIALAATGAVATGVLLATLASLYPSWAAAHMAPMEAMRIE